MVMGTPGDIVDPSDWESNFSVLDPRMSTDMPTRCPWVVWDAECQFVCRCATKEAAEAIVLALHLANAPYCFTPIEERDG